MPRPRLDRGSVVEMAERIVDRDGRSNLTMSVLATELGVRAPSLYSHVASLDTLLGYVQAKALGELGAGLQRAAMGKSGADGIRALATAQRDFAARHPGRYELAMSEPIDPAAMVEAGRPAGEALGAVIQSFGLSHASHELTFVCVSTLHGALQLDRAGLYRGAPLDFEAAYALAVELVVHVVERARSGEPR
jgi:AcrR family transcriptional regulator